MLFKWYFKPKRFNITFKWILLRTRTHLMIDLLRGVKKSIVGHNSKKAFRFYSSSSSQGKQIIKLMQRVLWLL